MSAIANLVYALRTIAEGAADAFRTATTTVRIAGRVIGFLLTSPRWIWLFFISNTSLGVAGREQSTQTAGRSHLPTNTDER